MVQEPWVWYHDSLETNPLLFFCPVLLASSGLFESGLDKNKVDCCFLFRYFSLCMGLAQELVGGE